MTHRILQVLADIRNPYAIVMKLPLFTHDIDLIAPMAAMVLATVAVSVTTLDRVLAQQLEPRDPDSNRRRYSDLCSRRANDPGTQ